MELCYQKTACIGVVPSVSTAEHVAVRIQTQPQVRLLIIQPVIKQKDTVEDFLTNDK